MLDKSRPYGEIFGSTDGSKYEQDGYIFNAAGEKIGGEGPQEQPKNRGGRPPKKVEPTVDAELEAQIQANLGA